MRADRPTPGFLTALQFLTRIPVRVHRAGDLAASVVWFPVVGGLVGLLAGAVYAGLVELVPDGVAAVVAVLAGVVVTGAFHEDGLADAADGLGGWSPEERREILTDSRHGSYGVAALCGSIVLRVVAVASLGPAAAVAGLVAAHALGRGVAVVAMGWARPVPTEGLGADYARAVGRRRAVAGGAVALCIAALATGWWAVPTATAAGLGGAVVVVIATRAFGGVSGDILGAVEQVAECLVLVVVSGLALRHAVAWT